MTREELANVGIKVGDTIFSPSGIQTKVVTICTGYKSGKHETMNVKAVHSETGHCYNFREIVVKDSAFHALN